MKSPVMLLFSILLLTSSLAQADYFVTYFGMTGLDANRETHVIVAGRGAELNTLFQGAAAARARKLQELYPSNQILVLAYNEIGQVANSKRLRDWGLSIAAYRKGQVFSVDALLRELAPFKKIASFDTFTHTSAHHGAQLEGLGYRMGEQNPEVAVLKSKFVPGAWAVMHGCNSGYTLAPFLSKVWGIPVAGSFNATSFERLHSTNNFYMLDESLKPPGDWAALNALSFNQPISCTEGACSRMKPDNWPYNGVWGDFKNGGLPFYKFFCAKNTHTECVWAAAEALHAFPGIKNYNWGSLDENRRALIFEWLCPIDARRPSLRSNCIRDLDLASRNGQLTYNPYQGRLLDCDSKACNVALDCEEDDNGQPVAGTCVVNNPVAKATTLVREYRDLVEGMKILSERGPRLGGLKRR